ncbi:MAG TPA: FAD-dependent oxidoreductase, partial [Candidatus Limnocylindrales bacterium]|nr:FAD-dependent oxidoreductase [Candidatus Limnocylindrales bacterium]
MPSSPKVVIIGAGIVGCSLADELVLRGWTDVTVVEQGPLFKTGGSTSHAPGIIFQTNASKTMQSFAMYAVQKAATLELDGRWCFNAVGSLELALVPERVAELHRRRDFAESWGLAGRVIDPDEATRLWPLVDTSR